MSGGGNTDLEAIKVIATFALFCVSGSALFGACFAIAAMAAKGIFSLFGVEMGIEL